MSNWDAELGELLAHRGRALVRYAYVLCGDRQEAEDLVQEAVVRVFSHWRRTGRRVGAERTTARGAGATVSVDTEDNGLEAYVRRTVLNLYVDGYRRRRHFSLLVPKVARIDEVRGPASGASVRVDVALALASLAPRPRACVVLRYFEDLSVPQIAVQLGIAEGTVKKYLHEAMKNLRGVLGPVDSAGSASTSTVTTIRTEVA
ncbi:sigma-70 family RNA polymerase sigma factor [Luteimicrobium subarcticum]|uniref:RNA polymerase sigma-70 factor (ECF subfamily) n=1 Tax=Luteimicrobium subarcticum TaxID=620910 RepID=A0A2M8WT77_9MICO|nr:sigma-70 family RNA polymerase sigma factor [Luteimicrobium subarcticum]PJI94155.1 RNA polymerase sigma-70 factor (ECF subfamily) [Luteimicrobium subarcticum]